jgi:hypothetical protein
MKRRVLGALFVAGLSLANVCAAESPLTQRNENLLLELQQVHGLAGAQINKIRTIFARSGFIGQGNPAISQHPDTPERCHAKLVAESVSYENRAFERVCGAKYMAPLYDPTTGPPERSRACIDQFEYPDIPCVYPVVWVRAREAAEICEAMGKRLCDAHEWEAACDGRLQEPDYRFDLAQGVLPEEAVRRMRATHNASHALDKRWSYGPHYERGICGTGSHKTSGCPGGGWALCGSNTYPAGDFPACHSPLGVYDLNGNVAEHMNLPLNIGQMASRGSVTLGYTEMKGSWFVFDTIRAHEDWCRWRAPFWHGSAVMDEHSHANYHLGFRCCKTVGEH